MYCSLKALYYISPIEAHYRVNKLFSDKMLSATIFLAVHAFSNPFKF